MRTRKCIAPLQAPQVQTDAWSKTTNFVFAARRKRTREDILAVRSASPRWRCPNENSWADPPRRLGIFLLYSVYKYYNVFFVYKYVF
jgi:hypothetical protein